MRNNLSSPILIPFESKARYNEEKGGDVRAEPGTPEKRRTKGETDMPTEIREAIKELKRQERELEERRSFLESLGEDDVLDENGWHVVCETPLRASPILGRFVLNMFPKAENVTVSPNYVLFSLSGFSVRIPTSRARGIEIDLNWYERDEGKPRFSPDPATKRMMEYYAAEDSGESRRKKAEILLGKPNGGLNPVSAVLAFRSAKTSRSKWEEKYRKELEDHERRTREYEEKRRQMKERARVLFEEVLPTLGKFSEKVKPFARIGTNGMTIEEIKEREFPEK